MTRRVRLLWADDQLTVSATLSSLLESLGADIRFVASGTDALKALQASYFDLVLVDLRMSPTDWGGLWLMRELARIGLSAPVLVLSGEGSQIETIQAMRLGALDYVMKELAQE